MKINNKEQVMWIAIFVIIVLFIIFMPSIESLLAGRKVKGNDRVTTDSTNKAGEVKEVTYPKTTNCTQAEALDGQTGANMKKEVTFTYNTSGTVTTINLTKIYRYNDVANYNKAKAVKPVNKAGIVETITPDDTNMTLTINDVMTVSELTELTEYPSGYSELNKFLSTNNYICTETK